MRRRAFLRTSGAALGGLALAGASTRPVVPRRLGVQLYTVRELLAHDVVGTLEAVRRIGYEEVEFAGLHGRSPVALRVLLDTLELDVPAAHVPLGALRDNLGAEIDAAHALGCESVVVPGVDESERDSLDAYSRLADEFNGLSARLRSAGLQLAYHNHADEFEPLGGASGYDVLLAETDPALVAMELDVFWAVHAGRDPIALLDAHPGRFPLLHLKDRTAGGAMADVGAGTIDWARLLAHAERASVRHAFVEHDAPTDALASIGASRDALIRLRG